MLSPRRYCIDSRRYYLILTWLLIAFSLFVGWTKWSQDHRPTLVYVKVPKTASNMMFQLMWAMANRTRRYDVNPFRWFSNKKMDRTEQAEVVSEIFAPLSFWSRRPMLYARHFHLIDFKRLDAKRRMPELFSFVRDPIKRFVSYYDFKRYTYVGWGRRLFERHFHNATREPRVRKAYLKWKEKDINECILKDDDECRIDGPHWDILQAIPYFCGQDSMCGPHRSSLALTKAKEHVASLFGAVGVLERLNDTFAVMESVWPQYFEGIAGLYRNIEPREMVGEHKSVLTEESRLKLKRELRLEYDLYDFILNRLDEQIMRMTRK